MRGSRRTGGILRPSKRRPKLQKLRLKLPEQNPKLGLRRERRHTTNSRFATRSWRHYSVGVAIKTVDASGVVVRTRRIMSLAYGVTHLGHTAHR